jgi:hypothetical protein
MARDSMHPWLDRSSLGELEGAGVSPRSAFGWREWDGNDSARDARAYGRSAIHDTSALPVPAPRQVEVDPFEDFLVEDDLDFAVASY